MPITWSYDAPSNIATLVIALPYTFNDWRRAMDAILGHVPPDDYPVRFLVDRRHAGTPSAGMATDMVEYFRQQAFRWHGTRSAVVVSDDAAYGMARLVAIRTDLAEIGLHLDVFRDMDDAMQWLFTGEASNGPLSLHRPAQTPGAGP